MDLLYYIQIQVTQKKQSSDPWGLGNTLSVCLLTPFTSILFNNYPVMFLFFKQKKKFLSSFLFLINWYDTLWNGASTKSTWANEKAWKSFFFLGIKQGM